jgi:hypothetical protein
MNISPRLREYLILGALCVAIPALALEPEAVVEPTRDTPDNTGPTSPSRVLPGEPPVHKNYWLPLVEIAGFEFALNQADRVIFDDGAFDSTWASGWDHVRHGHWTVDQDVFTVNQIGHPDQGTIYHGIARSSGLNFWES